MVKITLAPDEKVGNRWKVVKKLGEGEFSTIYQAIDETCKEEFAIKIEPSDQNSVLKMEAYVLMELRGRSAHACMFVGCGMQDGKFNYLVMTLVGQNLSDLHRSRPDRKFSSATTARLAIQCVQGLQDLHMIGFVHRGLKPSNLAIGRTTADRRFIYILSHSKARRYMSDLTTKELRPPRTRCDMRGTVRYASVNAQAGLEQGRHDDLLRLMYVLIEFRSGRLPWNDLDDDDGILRMKMKVPPAQLFKDLDDEYGEIYVRMAMMTYHETPDYDWIVLKLQRLQKRQNYPDDGPFEWE